MAKKKKFINLGGGVKAPLPHFNNPVLQQALQHWFVDMPMQAPLQVVWDEPTQTEKNARQKELNSRALMSRSERLHPTVSRTPETYITGPESEGGGTYVTNSPAYTAALNRMKEAGYGVNLGAGVSGLPGTKEMAGELGKNNQLIAASGENPVGQKHTGNSIFGRIMDVLSRGVYGSAAATRASFHAGEQLGQGQGWSGFEKIPGAFVRGVEGKDKDTYSKMAQDAHLAQIITGGLNKISGGNTGFAGKHSNERAGKFFAAGLGLTGDIGLDPTTYAGFGLIPKAGKAASLGEKALEHLSLAGKIDKDTGELVSGGRYIKGKVGRAAAQGEKAQIIEPLQKLKTAVKSKRLPEIKQDMYSSPEWQEKFNTVIGPTKQKKLLTDFNKTAKEIAEKEATDWEATAIKNYEDVVNTQIKRGIGVGLAGYKGKKITVVPAPIATAFAGAITSPDSVQKGLRVFNDAFKASADTFPELHNIRLSTIGAGFARAHYLGHELRQTFRGVSHDTREMAYQIALDRGSNSGQFIKVRGQDVDAAEYMSGRISAMENKVSGLATGDPPFTLKELNDSMPPGSKDKFTGGTGLTWVRDSMKKWDQKDGPSAIWMAEQAIERATARRAMLSSMAETFGVRTEGTGALKGAGKIFADLQGKGWRQLPTSKTHGLLDGVLFDPEVAKGMEKIMSVLENEREWSKFARVLAKINNPIKFTYTMINPGFHIRNAMGDAFINMIDNVSLRSYDQARRVLSKQTDKYGGMTPLLMQEGDILENAFKRPNQSVLFHMRNPVKKPNGTKGTAITEAEIFGGMNKYGIRQNYALSEYGTLAEQPIRSKAIMSQARSKLVEASELREDYFRLAHFIQLVKKNKRGFTNLDQVMADAAADIRKMHFDYTDFTKFEKQWMSNVFPFYKWTRKALPLMTELMLTQPGKVVIPTKAQQALSTMMGQDPYGEPLPNLQGLVPSWMIDAGYDPGAEIGGQPTMFQLPSPAGDLINSVVDPGLTSGLSGPKNVAMSMLTPAFKVPYELSENKNSFLSARAGQDVPLVRPGQSRLQAYSQYAINQLPYARQVSRATTGGDKANLGSLISQLSGIYAQQVTPSMQRGELFRQRDLSRKKVDDLKANIKTLLDKQGLDVPHTNEGWLTLIRLWKQQNR